MLVGETGANCKKFQLVTFCKKCVRSIISVNVYIKCIIVLTKCTIPMIFRIVVFRYVKFPRRGRL